MGPTETIKDPVDEEYINTKIHGPKNGIVTVLLTKIKLQVKDTLLCGNIQSLIERGASRVRKKVGGDAETAVDDMNARASEAQQNMRDYSSKDSVKEKPAPKPKQDLANDIGLPDKDGKRTHKSPVIDAPKDSPSLEVNYNGKKTTLGDIKNQDV